MTIVCPVCRRRVYAIEHTGRVCRHDDTARHTCPMSGRIYPLDEERSRHEDPEHQAGVLAVRNHRVA